MYSTETVGDSVGGISALKLTGHAVVFHHIGHHIIRVAVPAHHGLPVCLLVPRTPCQTINMRRPSSVICVMIVLHGDMKYTNLDMKLISCDMKWISCDMRLNKLDMKCV